MNDRNAQSFHVWWFCMLITDCDDPSGHFVLVFSFFLGLRLNYQSTPSLTNGQSLACYQRQNLQMLCSLTFASLLASLFIKIFGGFMNYPKDKAHEFKCRYWAAKSSFICFNRAEGCIFLHMKMECSVLLAETLFIVSLLVILVIGACSIQHNIF